MKVLRRFSAELGDDDLWVFGYGSLMWNPGFPFVEKHRARLHGYHRSLCVSSPRHRGTPEEPGLVMGLAPGGSCHGMAFLVERARVRETLLALWYREMRGGTYHPRLIGVRIAQRTTLALAFVVDRTHRNYAGELAVEEIAHRVVRCRGHRGPNSEYLLNTVVHLEGLGVHDHRLVRVLEAVRAVCG